MDKKIRDWIEKWKKKYPNVANKIDALEKRVKYLEEIHMNDGK